MTKEIKLQAISIRRVDYKDNDGLITLFSKERGKVTAVAKGINKPNAKLKYASFLCYGDYILAERGDYHTIVSVDVRDMFINIRDDYNKYCAAGVILESLKIAINEENEQIFDLVISSLTAINQTQNADFFLLNKYLLALLTKIGYRPQLDRCCYCGKIITPSCKPVLDLEQGGLCCKCHSTSFRAVLSEGELKLLWALEQGGQSSSEYNQFSYRVAKELIAFFSAVTGVKLKSEELLLP